LKLEEIARLAGVSKATVSSVLNGKAEKYRISTDTQARIREIARQHGYQPNYSAAALRRGKTKSIGFIVPDFENRSYLRIAKRLEALARKDGYQLIIASSDDEPETEILAARMMVSRGIDALLVSSCTNDEAGVYQAILKKGTPVVALDRPLTAAFSSVTSDDRLGAFELVRSMGLSTHGNVVLIGAMPDIRISRLREQGFREALADKSGLKGYCFYGKHFDVPSGTVAFMQAVAALGGLPDAVMTTSFSLLEGVMECLQSAWQDRFAMADCPVRLATFGNSRMLDFLPVPVNSLPQQYELIAEAAWQQAKQGMEAHYVPETVVINRLLRNRLPAVHV
jgi:LacI family fructose operon transcriptional repressor